MNNEEILVEIIKSYNTSLNPKLLLYNTFLKDLYSKIKIFCTEIVKSTTLKNIDKKKKFTAILISENDMQYLDFFVDLLEHNGFIVVIGNKQNERIYQHLITRRLITYRYLNLYYIGIKNTDNLLSNHTSIQASVYDDYVAEYEDDIDFIKKFIRNKKDILEIGVGTGRLALKLSKGKETYYGIDYSESMLKILDGKCKSRALPLKYFNQDMINFNLDKLFDVILYPYRVLPYCETKEMVEETLVCSKRHLKDTKSRILINMLYFSEDYICKWNNKTYKFEFNHNTSQKWTRIDYMTFDKSLMYRQIKILNEFNEVVIETKDNLLGLAAEELCEICKKIGFKIYDIWPAYSYTTYCDEMEYLVSIGPI